MLLCAAILSTGCAATGQSFSSSDGATVNKGYEMTVEYDESYDEALLTVAGDANLTGAEETADTSTSSRKLITTMTMEVETEDYDAFITALETRVSELGGYIESSSMGSYTRNVGESRYADYELRIPQEHIAEMTDAIGTESNVLYKSENTEDVTLTYVDIASRIEVYRTEEERLLEMLSEVGNISDMLTVEERLSEVQAEINSLESRLRTYDNACDYATISLSVNEVLTYTQTDAVELTTGQRIAEGLKDSFSAIGSGLTEFFVGLIVNLPYILLVLVLIALPGIIPLVIVKKRKKRQE